MSLSELHNLHLIFSPKSTSNPHFNHLFNKYIKPLYLLGTTVNTDTTEIKKHNFLNFKNLIGALSKYPEH